MFAVEDTEKCTAVAKCKMSEIATLYKRDGIPPTQFRTNFPLNEAVLKVIFCKHVRCLGHQSFWLYFFSWFKCQNNFYHKSVPLTINSLPIIKKWGNFKRGSVAPQIKLLNFIITSFFYLLKTNYTIFQYFILFLSGWISDEWVSVGFHLNFSLFRW